MMVTALLQGGMCVPFFSLFCSTFRTEVLMLPFKPVLINFSTYIYGHNIFLQVRNSCNCAFWELIFDAFIFVGCFVNCCTHCSTKTLNARSNVVSATKLMLPLCTIVTQIKCCSLKLIKHQWIIMICRKANNFSSCFRKRAKWSTLHSLPSNSVSLSSLILFERRLGGRRDEK